MKDFFQKHINRLKNESDTLYDPMMEHDACGVGFVAHIKGIKSHKIVKDGLKILVNLTHRGAAGCDPCTGDGAGILIQIPDQYFREKLMEQKVALPNYGKYATGIVFLPKAEAAVKKCKEVFETVLEKQGLKVLLWRAVPLEVNKLGVLAKSVMPEIQQVFVVPDEKNFDESKEAFERRLYIARKFAKKECMKFTGNEKFYCCSLSTSTIVYKGLLLPDQVDAFYLDLRDRRVVSAIALVHSRFSTNTLPTWELSHPFRYLCHNGEINTLRGNKLWMQARESILEGKYFSKEDVDKICPIIDASGSDSACFDNLFELFLLTGRSLPETMMIMIPEAWEKHPEMDAKRRAFYSYHASTMEPWDGPADMAFSDGRYVGATLDRNGLRPARYLVTDDDIIILGSETGVLPVDPAKVRFKGRLQPGKMFIVDTEQGKIIEDEDIKKKISSSKDYAKWLKEYSVSLDDLREATKIECKSEVLSGNNLINYQRIFGYSLEDLRMILIPMAQGGKEPVGSMGNDTPLAILSEKSRNFFDYFKQLFAQVTNPPIDPIREETVMSLLSLEGAQTNFLVDTPDKCRRIEFSQPILTTADIELLLSSEHKGIKSSRISMLYNPNVGEDALQKALDRLSDEAKKLANSGISLIILSDRGTNSELAPIPSLLATSAVHHSFIRAGLRMKTGLIIETGDTREVAHMALLLGYGAGAICPYLALDTIRDLAEKKLIDDKASVKDCQKKYIKAIGEGLLKVFSKMGISTLQSYKGAQLYEAIGLSSKLVEKYFKGTPSRIEGIDLIGLNQEIKERFNQAFSDQWIADRLDLGGQYHYRVHGEFHQWNPETVSLFQRAVRENDYKRWKEFSSLSNDQSKNLATIRGLLEIKKGNPIPLEEVEPISAIVKRFATGAMSFGSISREAHESLAIAMNRLGGKSNTGEGGEDASRFIPLPNGDSKRSAIKQIASGRFGVTTDYLVNADELQIKMAQGAKPGEGGQLPGHKVNEEIAAVRHSTPGVQLISPPPHHDIYSIEDLAQLIFDLKNVNPAARVSVKLVAEFGVGTVAAGVAKAHADLVLISGHDGGTGASPVSSIKHAGIPWELGLAETQQVLVQNDLRSRIVVQADGQLKTGRDVAIAALLGAEEYGFATSGLVALGCVMMRKCHLNTCPVGIATQDPNLRSRFTGKPEHIVNFLTFVAHEVREIMAQLGFRKLDEMVGRVDLLDARKVNQHWKAKGLDLSKILAEPKPLIAVSTRYCSTTQDHGVDKVLDRELIELCKSTLDNKTKVRLDLPIANFNRTVGAMLSGELVKRHGPSALNDGSIKIKFTGSAGQSFGAFLAKGIEFELEGDSNDYLGKGLSGGRIIAYPHKQSVFKAEDNILVGNTLLYGATSGEVFLRGMAGERFAVRNSGATAVVEGLGDHGCEYMTGGVVVCLGKTGRNFAAGMSGGLAYVFDPEDRFENCCNPEMVTLETVPDEDQDYLKNLIERHCNYTGSELASRILFNWNKSIVKFKKVYPVEYRRVLEARKAASKGEKAHG